MNLPDAQKRISNALNQMAVAMGETVFDEWGVVDINQRPARVLAYAGPREKGFIEQLPEDVKSLRAALKDCPYEVGDFEFARHGAGEQHDSLIVLGPGLYLLLNNTGKTIAEITAVPKWMGAQRVYVALAESFRVDPLG